MIGMIETQTNYWKRPMHGLNYLRAHGHLLSVYWRYKTIATLTLCHSPFAVHAGLRAALQGFHGGRECPSCSSLFQYLGLTCCSLLSMVLLPNFLIVGLYSMRVYWFFFALACGLFVAPSWLPRGLSLQWEAKIYLLLVGLHHHRRVWRFVCTPCCWWQSHC